MLSCELLSKFVSLWLQTTLTGNGSMLVPLWITFKICIFVIFNNWQYRIGNNATVVNYFQNLYLCDFQQLSYCNNLSQECCELLSKFVSLWLSTTAQKSVQFLSSCELLSKFVSLWLQTTPAPLLIVEMRLWITFKICIFVIANNNSKYQ